MRCNSTRPCSLLTAASLTLVAPCALSSQTLSVSLRSAALLSPSLGGSLGARVDAGSARLGAYGHVGRFMTSQGCAASLPPRCNHPSSGGTELSGGLRVTFPTAARSYPVLAVGAGALLWDDDPPYRSKAGLLVDVELGVQGRFVSWADYSAGLKLQRVAQSVSGGMRLESASDTYVGVVGGLVIPLRPADGHARPTVQLPAYTMRRAIAHDAANAPHCTTRAAEPRDTRCHRRRVRSILIGTVAGASLGYAARDFPDGGSPNSWRVTTLVGGVVGAWLGYIWERDCERYIPPTSWIDPAAR